MSDWVVIPAALLCGALLASSLRKARRAQESVGLRETLGVPPGLWSTIGVLEGVAAAGLLVGLVRPAVGAAAACGVALLMAGAVLAHLRTGLTGRWIVPPTVLLGVAVAAALGYGGLG